MMEAWLYLNTMLNEIMYDGSMTVLKHYIQWTKVGSANISIIYYAKGQKDFQLELELELE